ncbi:winged helix-turn-helix domain-containing protein [Lapillicoccus jejuensis]|uniref:winged helix-turn-helix domain-containing protein n=1 Tax=Lapillicoccus jejuensis TaxID=402171 RepID=UPI001150D5D1|nr:helix-turn-helix domain-containing protein [Lapillicoccus jejuensis]
MTRLDDPRMLRALAHPVRARILDELTAQGSLRAADVAAELDIPANQASFHLRQLAKYGLVEEDAGAARDRRDRVWRATSPEGYDVDMQDLESAPGGRAASRVYRSHTAARAHALVDAAHGGDRTPGIHRSISQVALRLDREEARQLTTELNEVVDRWAARTRGRDAHRQTYSAYLMVQPYPDGLESED